MTNSLADTEVICRDLKPYLPRVFDPTVYPSAAGRRPSPRPRPLPAAPPVDVDPDRYVGRHRPLTLRVRVGLALIGDAR